VQEQRKRWLRALCLKLTIVLSAVMILALVFYEVVGEGVPESYWMTCGVVGVVLLVAWRWHVI